MENEKSFGLMIGFNGIFACGSQKWIELYGSSTIGYIKEQILDKHGWSIESQVLKLDDLELEDDKTVNYYGINEKSKISCFQK